MSGSGIIVKPAGGRSTHARWSPSTRPGTGCVGSDLTRFGDEWLLMRADARDVSRGAETPPVSSTATTCSAASKRRSAPFRDGLMMRERPREAGARV